MMVVLQYGQEVLRAAARGLAVTHQCR